jgi:hypothetical protein
MARTPNETVVRSLSDFGDRENVAVSLKAAFGL